MSSCYRSTNSFKYKVDLNKINPGGLQRSPSAKDTDLKIRADFQRCCPPTTRSRSAGCKLIWDFQQIHLWYQVENLRWPPPRVITFTRLYKSLIPDLDAEIFRRAPMAWTSQAYIPSFLMYHIWTKCGISCVEMKKTESRGLTVNAHTLTAWISKLTFQAALYILVIANS